MYGKDGAALRQMLSERRLQKEYLKKAAVFAPPFVQWEKEGFNGKETGEQIGYARSSPPGGYGDTEGLRLYPSRRGYQQTGNPGSAPSAGLYLCSQGKQRQRLGQGSGENTPFYHRGRRIFHDP